MTVPLRCVFVYLYSAMYSEGLTSEYVTIYLVTLPACIQYKRRLLYTSKISSCSDKNIFKHLESENHEIYMIKNLNFNSKQLSFHALTTYIILKINFGRLYLVKKAFKRKSETHAICVCVYVKLFIRVEMNAPEITFSTYT